jgi:hypothetical protein
VGKLLEAIVARRGTCTSCCRWIDVVDRVVVLRLQCSSRFAEVVTLYLADMMLSGSAT